MSSLRGLLYRDVPVEIPITVEEILEMFDADELIYEVTKNELDEDQLLDLVLTNEESFNKIFSAILNNPEISENLDMFIEDNDIVEDIIKNNPMRWDNYLDMIDFKHIVDYVKRHQNPASENISVFPPTDYKVSMPECKPPKKPLHEMTLLEIVQHSMSKG